MLCLSGFKLYSRWVPLVSVKMTQQRQRKLLSALVSFGNVY